MSLSTGTYQTINKQLSAHLLQNNLTIKFEAIGGGSINKTYKIAGANKFFFCKINSATKFPQLFKKEEAGLQQIKDQHCIKTPAIISNLIENDEQILILEWIEEGEKTISFWKRFGEQLAQLHHCTNNYFGLNENNYMGAVPQLNHQQNSWVKFFIENRLQPIIKNCFDKNLLSKKHLINFEKLYTLLPSVFNEEPPALLHGDLWSGNFLCNKNSDPVLIDPAVYYGHRSTDLAMTTLFGGFHQSFYESYHFHFPLPANYLEQWEACNLYPLLIHLQLFGKSYLPNIENILQQFD